MHISTTETWLRSVLEDVEDSPEEADDDLAPAGTKIADGLWPELGREETR